MSTKKSFQLGHFLCLKFSMWAWIIWKINTKQGKLSDRFSLTSPKRKEKAILLLTLPLQNTDTTTPIQSRVFEASRSTASTVQALKTPPHHCACSLYCNARLSVFSKAITACMQQAQLAATTSVKAEYF